MHGYAVRWGEEWNGRGVGLYILSTYEQTMLYLFGWGAHFFLNHAI